MKRPWSHTRWCLVRAWLVLVLVQFAFVLPDSIDFGDVEQQQGEFMRSLTDYSIVHPDRVSGTGRERRSDGESPHATFHIVASGESLLLDLYPSSHHFIAPNLVIHHYVNGRIVEELLSEESRLCHFVGKVRGHRRSSVAVSTCSGLNGMFLTREGDYFIEPVRFKNRSHDLITSSPHLVYKRALPSHQLTCHSVDNELQDDRRAAPADYKANVRPRRSSGKWTVETVVVADHTVIEHHKNNSKGFLLCVMNMVSQLYRHPTIGHAVNVVVVDVVMLDKNQTIEAGLHERETGISLLEHFCHWQRGGMKPRPVEYDNAVFITRAKLCENSEQYVRNWCSLVGLANVKGTCDRTKRCSVSRDNGLSLAFTVAHEIGHTLGMQHDGERGNMCKPNGNKAKLMASSLLEGSMPFEWSKCSRDYLATFLESESSRCLQRNDSESPYVPLPTDLPNSMKDPNRQCEMSYGPGATACRLGSVCKSLYCQTADSYCSTDNFPAAPGTTCQLSTTDSNRADGVCHSGICKARGDIPAKTDGGWGKWGKFQECSRTCGVGIQVSRRKCEAPSPSGGGRYCVGQRERFRVCSTKHCPEKSREFRDDQCHIFNHRKQSNGRLADSSITWKAVYETMNVSDPGICRLTCISKKTQWIVGTKVIDGTRCYPGSSEYCINGQCVHIGCDGKLGSSAVEDACRVCNGDNSTCERVAETKTYEHGKRRQAIAKIPKGSVNINFTKTCSKSNLLRIGTSKEHSFFLFKKEFGLANRSQSYRLAGTVFFYVVHPNEMESFFALGPTDDQLTVWVHLRDREKADVDYSYYVPNGTYQWHLTKWTNCSKSCDTGTQMPLWVCRYRGSPSEVDDVLCNDEPVPDRRPRYCNTEKCDAVHRIWAVMPWKPCNATCGVGYQHRDVWCVSQHDKLSDEDCSAYRKPSVIKQCRRLLPDCDIGWQVDGNWSECSATCGTGTKSRSVKCVQNFDNKVLPDSKCLKLGEKDPRTTECSIRKSCGGKYYWNIGDWTDCSVTCGSGNKTRNVTCRQGMEMVPESECQLPKPSEREDCQLLPCPGTCTETDDFCLQFVTNDSLATLCQKSIVQNMCSCYCRLFSTLDKR